MAQSPYQTSINYFYFLKLYYNKFKIIYKGSKTRLFNQMKVNQSLNLLKIEREANKKRELNGTCSNEDCEFKIKDELKHDVLEKQHMNSNEVNVDQNVIHLNPNGSSSIYLMVKPKMSPTRRPFRRQFYKRQDQVETIIKSAVNELKEMIREQTTQMSLIIKRETKKLDEKIIDIFTIYDESIRDSIKISLSVIEKNKKIDIQIINKLKELLEIQKQMDSMIYYNMFCFLNQPNFTAQHSNDENGFSRFYNQPSAATFNDNQSNAATSNDNQTSTTDSPLSPIITRIPLSPKK